MPSGYQAQPILLVVARSNNHIGNVWRCTLSRDCFNMLLLCHLGASLLLCPLQLRQQAVFVLALSTGTHGTPNHCHRAETHYSVCSRPGLVLYA